jgi:elongation factor Ts
VKAENGFGAIIALKCETDFVANNADFVALTQTILDAAVANKCKTLDEVKALPMGNGTIQDAVTERSGITGEKMELDGYNVIESEFIATYNHMGRNSLCTMLALNKAIEDATVGKNIAMQIASAAPVAIDESGVPQSVKDNEVAVAIEKTKAEQVQKAVEAAIKKAGYNPAHFDSEDHMESNQGKGWITAEDVVKVKEIIATVSAEKAANLNEQMIKNIAMGRLNKFLKESCLLSQEYIWDKSMTVASYLQSIDKDLTITDFKRFTLRSE